VEAVRGLVARLLGPQFVASFDLALVDPQPNTGNDVFRLLPSSTIDGRVVVPVRGSSGVALASGLYWYLKYHCNASVTWGESGTGDNLVLPNPLPQVATEVSMNAPVRWRYYMNVCTVSYSSAWWDWARWEREIDWMALHGINLPLSFTGQELVWTEVWKGLGLTDAEIEEFYTGPAFLAWNRMGNVQGWGGPLTKSWRVAQAELQKKIVQRQREFGMKNVLSAFAGHVPAGLKRVHPNANMTLSPTWATFSDAYRVWLLNPFDPLFQKIGAAFIEAQTRIFGTDHIYNADTFNELDPPSADPSYLAAASDAVYQGMAIADPKALWLMQGWLFRSEWWTNERIKAYLSGVKNDNMLILDLYAEVDPIWRKTESYFGKPFIWCMLHNFGGNRDLYGNLTHIGTAPVTARTTSGSTMVGTGLTMEAIEQNPVIYELMSEMGWRSEEVKVSEWLDHYVSYRYGADSPSAKLAWRLLHESAYQHPEIVRSIYTVVPDRHDPTSLQYNPDLLVEAWGQMLASRKELPNPEKPNGPWEYDLVDITRQALDNLFYDVYGLLDGAYDVYVAARQDPHNQVKNLGAGLVQLLSELELILSTNENYLLGVWTERAKAWATNGETELYEFNARNQLTLWGPNGEINDYASKEWSGLVGDYYKVRWQIFVAYLYDSIIKGQVVDTKKYASDLLVWEQRWNNQTNSYPTKPKGNAADVSQMLYDRYVRAVDIRQHFRLIRNTDAPTNDIHKQPTTKVTGQLMYLCYIDPVCKGFNSNGQLKTSVTSTVPSSSVDLYVRVDN
jgi:alpha-N-acetylglucosaminidase